MSQTDLGELPIANNVFPRDAVLPVASEAAGGLAQPENEAGVSLQKRLLNPKTLLSFAIALLLLFTIFKKFLGGDFTKTAQVIGGVNPLVYALAFAGYALTFPARGFRWHQLLRNVGEDQPRGKLTQFLFLSWFVNCLVPAKIGDVYRGYLLKKNCDVSLSKSMGTIFAERIIDTLIIFFTFGVTGLVVFHEKLPGEVRLIIGIGIGFAVLMVAALLFMRHFGEAVFARFAPPRFQDVYKRFEEGTLGSFKAFEVILFFTFAAWVFEAVRLFAVVHALAGGSPELAQFNFVQAIFAMVAASILTLVPTPGGLGAVEGGLAGILYLVGLQPGVALAVAIMDRVVSYWALVAGGAVGYFVSKSAR